MRADEIPHTHLSVSLPSTAFLSHRIAFLNVAIRFALDVTTRVYLI